VKTLEKIITGAGLMTCMATAFCASDREKGQQTSMSCIPDGQGFDAKFDHQCCPGLTVLEPLEEGVPMESDTDTSLAPGCMWSDAPPRFKSCGACGNGVCASVENGCNCPEDCKPPG
jgi:hypothetical protein